MGSASATNGGGLTATAGQERANRPAVEGDEPEADGQGPLFVLPTYTAMLALRELLVRRGEASSSWQ